MKVFALYLGLLLVGLGVACQCPPYKPFKPVEVLYQASPLTMSNSFTAGIEGPACDRTGNIFAVNFGKQQTIGVTTPDGISKVFVTLPNTSIGNGIRFDHKGLMYVADYTEHNVLRIDPTTKAIEIFAHEPKMNQPNDLAIGPNGVLYASDPTGLPRPANFGALTLMGL
jgi:sugar lactone lactonase YvrE